MHQNDDTGVVQKRSDFLECISCMFGVFHVFQSHSGLDANGKQHCRVPGSTV